MREADAGKERAGKRRTTGEPLAGYPHQAGKAADAPVEATVQKQVQRDTARGILCCSTEAQPLTIVLGADGTGVGKRGIMHVGVSVAPSYKEGISQQNERNLNTVATSVTDDHWGGLNETLCAGYYTGKPIRFIMDNVQITALCTSPLHGG